MSRLRVLSGDQSLKKAEEIALNSYGKMLSWLKVTAFQTGMVLVAVAITESQNGSGWKEP